MYNFIKIAFLSVTLLVFSTLCHSTELLQCDSCTASAMKNLAKNSGSNGKFIIVYDTNNKISNKYFVFTSVEPGNVNKNAFGRTMSPEEEEFMNNFFSLYDQLGEEFKSIVITVPAVNIGNDAGFSGISAYDIFNTGQLRNQLTDAINNDLNNILNGNQAASNSVSLIGQAIDQILNVDLSLTIIVVMEDGSQVVIEISVKDGLYPKHKKDDVRNRDANNNPILQSNGSSSVGNYIFSNAEQLNNFLMAAQLYGVPITNGTGDTGGVMRCSFSGSILKCIYYPK